MALEHVSTSAVLKGMFRKEKAWAIIADYARYARIMKNVESVTVRERSDKEGVSEWSVSIDGAPLSWIEKDYYDKENFELNFESINGDLDAINGRWKIENHNHEGIEITFDVKYDLGIPVIEEVLGPTLKEKMKSNIQDMVASIETELKKEQVEERKFERFALGTHHHIRINGNSIRVAVVNVSQAGMMIRYDGMLNLVNATVKINGSGIDSEIILNDIKQKNYRIRFNRILEKDELDKVIAILSHETSQVQEAVVVENQYETA